MSPLLPFSKCYLNLKYDSSKFWVKKCLIKEIANFIPNPREKADE